MSKHKWEYVRTNSKGEAIFRKDTGQTLDHCIEYLKDKGIEYAVIESATLIVIYSRADRPYMYYWTTGRWSARKRSYTKHFHSDGIEDFVEKYLNKYADEHIREDQERYGDVDEDSKTSCG
tara:strand:- start:176 stop:538 length:363 start_codon:yes stop_codon:yes gene_type:complete